MFEVYVGKHIHKTSTNKRLTYSPWSAIWLIFKDTRVWTLCVVVKAINKIFNVRVFISKFSNGYNGYDFCRFLELLFRQDISLHLLSQCSQFLRTDTGGHNFVSASKTLGIGNSLLSSSNMTSGLLSIEKKITLIHTI